MITTEDRETSTMAVTVWITLLLFPKVLSQTLLYDMRTEVTGFRTMEVSLPSGEPSIVPVAIEYTNRQSGEGYTSRVPPRRSPLEDKTIKIGLLTRWRETEAPYGAVSLAVERAMEEGLLEGYNIT